MELLQLCQNKKVLVLPFDWCNLNAILMPYVSSVCVASPSPLHGGTITTLGGGDFKGGRGTSIPPVETLNNVPHGHID